MQNDPIIQLRLRDMDFVSGIDRNFGVVSRDGIFRVEVKLRFRCCLHRVSRGVSPYDKPSSIELRPLP